MDCIIAPYIYHIFDAYQQCRVFGKLKLKVDKMGQEINLENSKVRIQNYFIFIGNKLYKGASYLVTTSLRTVEQYILVTNG